MDLLKSLIGNQLFFLDIETSAHNSRHDSKLKKPRSVEGTMIVNLCRRETAYERRMKAIEQQRFTKKYGAVVYEPPTPVHRINRISRIPSEQSDLLGTETTELEIDEVLAIPMPSDESMSNEAPIVEDSVTLSSNHHNSRAHK
jgi:hypothetical protein